MSNAQQIELGTVDSLWRYPVKSMAGEELEASEVTDRGLLGDRAYALIDRADGKAATAKNPKKWPRLFDFRAAYANPPRAGETLPAVSIKLPDGNSVGSDRADINQILSQALNRDVTLSAASPGTVKSEQYWPDMEGFDHRETVTEFTLPEGTFFDCATVHVVTTATLNRLQELYPQGRFAIPRFRANIVLRSHEKGFVENDWVGRTIGVGEAVRLKITAPAGRCVMTTLPQGDLLKDPGILRTAAQHNGANVGVYASVLRGGTIRKGDSVIFD